MDAALDPDEISKILEVSPSKVQRRGEPHPRKPGKAYSKSGWFLATEGVLESKDARHHLDWILELVKNKRDAFQILHTRGYLVDLCVFWDSANGHGGPTISPSQMKILSELEIELWFDVYLQDSE